MTNWRSASPPQIGSDPVPYGLTTAQRTALVGAFSEWHDATAAARAAVETKLANRETLTTLLR